MKFVTDLMDKISSDSTPKDFGNQIYDKVQESFSNGNSDLYVDGEQYAFADCGDGSCVIEQKGNKEVTVAKPGSKGELNLSGVAPSSTPTQKDVASTIEKTSGSNGKTDDKGLNPGSTENDVDVTIEKTSGSDGKTDVKGFSLCINGFDSPEDANDFYCDLDDALNDDSNISFSDDELENIAFSATELNKDYERLMGTQDLDLAYELRDNAEQLKSYSVLADANGHDMNDLYDACCIYSDYADDIINNIFSDMDVNDYFSTLNQDEINEYFSNLDDEVVANVLMSALQDPNDNYTFSDIDDIANDVYSELYEQEELDQCFSDLVSELDEDEQNSFFSQFNDVELNTISSVLEDNENASFSDINDALSEVSDSLNDLFSDASDDEVEDFCENFSDDELDTLQAMVDDSNENYTYSDFISYVNENRAFSEDDVDILAENANQIYSAVEDLMDNPSYDLAEQIYTVSDQLYSDACDASDQGHDVDSVIEAAQLFSEKAAEAMDAAPEDDKKESKKAAAAPSDEFDQMDTNKDGVISKEEWKAAGKDSKEFDEMDKNKDGKIQRAEWSEKAPEAKEDTKEKCDSYSYFGLEDKENKLFSNGTDYQQVAANPCLTSPIN